MPTLLPSPHDDGLPFRRDLCRIAVLLPYNLRRDYDRLVKLAGVPRIRIHDQRHTHVTLALQAGAPMGAVSKRVGHSRTSITMDLYAHVTEDMQPEAANTINAALFGAT